MTWQRRKSWLEDFNERRAEAEIVAAAVEESRGSGGQSADTGGDLAAVDRMLARRAGRPLTEAEVDGDLRRAHHPSLSEFVSVGLCAESARRAADGLLAGTYLSFEDACLSQTIFDTQRRNHLDESAMRDVAKRYAAPATLSEAAHTAVSQHLSECADCRRRYMGSRA